MTRVPAWRRYLRFWRPDVDADIDAELRFHMEERVADLMLRGRSREQAASQAAQEFGDVDAVRAGLHEIDTRVQQQRQRAGWLDALAQDLRYAVRSLARARAFSTMVVVTLALGFGVNAAMLGFLEQVFIRPPAGVASPIEVRRLWTWHTRSGTGVPFPGSLVTYRQYSAIAASMGATARVTATTPFSSVDIGDGRNAQVAWTEAGFFRTLGVRPQIGRFYGPKEDIMGAGAHVAVISDTFWRTQLGGDSSIIGKTLKISRDPYTIIGVAQRGFDGIDIDAVQAWVPLGALVMPGDEGTRWYNSDNYYPLAVILRVAPGVNEPALDARATAALRTAERQMRFPDTLSYAQLAPINVARGPGDRERSIKVATRAAAVVFIVLLIACANVTNLFLARAMQRRREIAVRLALGVSRRRLTMLVALEAMLLSLFGATAALLASLWGAAAMRRLLSPDTHWAGAALDWRSASWIATLALAAGVFIGMIAALRAGRGDLGTALKSSAREGAYQRSRLRMMLLAGQAALSVVLLVGAGLFVRSLHEVQSIDIGYDQRKLTFVSATFYGVDRKSKQERYAAGMQRIAEELGRVPGVEAVARTTTTPLRGFSFNELVIPGVDSATLVNKIGPFYAGVSPEFFRTVGMRIVRGRGFAEADGSGRQLVAVVNETMARAVWPNADALGKCIILGHRNDPCWTVVGVAQDAHSLGLLEKSTKAQYFTSLAQAPGQWVGSTIVVRSDPSRAAYVQREATRLILAEWRDAYPWAESMAAILEPAYRPWRLGATLFTAFGLLALLVAAVGVHSTLAYTFSQRTHEIGVRMALGARAGDVVRLVVSEGVRVVIMGVAIGIVLALALGRFVASLLYGVSAHDPVTLVGTAVVLVAIAALAALIPARRATRVDPVVALNADA